MMQLIAALVVLLMSTAPLAAEAPPNAQNPNQPTEIAPSHGRTLHGRVVNEVGEPLYLSVRIIREGVGYGSSSFLTHGGQIVADNLPRGDFVLEFEHLDYQPRILARGIHFEYGDKDIEVVLKRGPFPLHASIWTAVTGQPATQAAVDAFPCGEYVRSKERRYRQNAGVESVIEASVHGPREPPFPIRVVDESGEPVRTILVQDSDILSRILPVDRNSTFGGETEHAENEIVTLHSDDGLYEVQHLHVHIGAEGMARALNVYTQPHTDEPQTVVLQRAAGLAVTVRDFEGNPVAGAHVGPADVVPNSGRLGLLPFGPLLDWTLRVVTTDDDGRAELVDLPSDYRAFAAARPRIVGQVNWFDFRTQQGDSREWMASFHADLRPGETIEAEVVVPPWPEGSGPAILDSWMHSERQSFNAGVRWMQQFSLGSHLVHEFRKTPADLRAEMTQPLSREERAAMGREVVRRIKAAPARYHYADMESLALAALLLEWQDAVAPLQDWLRRVEFRTDDNRSWYPPHPNRAIFLIRILATVIELDGGDPAWFAHTAMAPDVDMAVRTACVIALGMLGTEEIVDAWRGLRETIHGKPGMPARTPGDTHADRMREAIVLTLYSVPGSEEGLDSLGLDALSVSRVRVDETFTWGHAEIRTFVSDWHKSWARLTLRRFGEDWLVTKIESGLFSAASL